MKWMTKVPSEPGWYWTTDHAGTKTIVNVWAGAVRLFVNSSSHDPEGFALLWGISHWAGPIPEPE